MPYEGMAVWSSLAYSCGWHSWHLQGSLECVNRTEFRNMTASVTRRNSCAHSGSKKGMSRVLLPHRSLCKEIRVNGRKSGRANWCNAACHLSQIVCVTSLALLFLLCNTQRRLIMVQDGKITLNETKHRSREDFSWARRFCWVWWRTESI